MNSVAKGLALLVAVALLAVGGWFLFVRDDDSSEGAGSPSTTAAPSTSGPSTTVATTTTTPKTCPTTGALASPSSGAGKLTKPTAVVANVQIQASDCTDEIAFAFRGGTPSWTVGYQPGPFVLDPSGKPATVAGTVYLVVRFEPAGGTDLTVSPPSTPYPGANDLHPPAPAELREVVKTGDFEGVMTWIVGLDSTRPFSVAERAAEGGLNQVVIDLPVKTPRATTCTNTAEHVRVQLPAGWFTELNDLFGPCKLFGAAPFVVIPQSDAMTAGAYALVDPAPFPGSTDGTSKLLSTKDTTVHGRQARVVEVESTGAGLLPAGTRTYTYLIDWGTLGTLRISASGMPSTGYDASKAGVDALAASAELVS